MLKNIISLTMILTCALSADVFAGRTELTTYYPAPHGEYNQLQANESKANRMAFGSTTEQPVTEGNVVFAAQTGANDPKDATPPAGRIGEIAYSSSQNAFYYNSTGAATGWAPLGSAGSPASWDCEIVEDTCIGGAGCSVGVSCPADKKLIAGGLYPTSGDCPAAGGPTTGANNTGGWSGRSNCTSNRVSAWCCK